MIKVTDLLEARARIEREAINPKPTPAPNAEPSTYARAPAASGAQQTGARPPATQRNSR